MTEQDPNAPGAEEPAPGSVAELRELVTTLAVQLKRHEQATAADFKALTNAVAILAGEELDDATPPQPVSWATLTEQTAAVRWGELLDWVREVLSRYPLAMRPAASPGTGKLSTSSSLLPGCWPHHPEIVQELDDLRVSWWAAYQAKTRRPAAGVEWHSTSLEPVIRRLERWWRLPCEKGEHTDPGRRHRLIPDDELLSTAIETDLQARPTGQATGEAASDKTPT